MSEFDNSEYSAYFQENSYEYDDISDKKKIRKFNDIDSPVLFFTLLCAIPLCSCFLTIHDSLIRKVLIVAYTLITVVLAVYSCYKKIHTHLTLVAKCTQLVNAQCFSVIPVIYKSDNQYIYHPKYKYIWNGVKYASSIGKTETKRKKGEIYPIMINPSNPFMIYDPFVKRKKTSAVVAESIMQLVTPLAITAFIFAFYYLPMIAK